DLKAQVGSKQALLDSQKKVVSDVNKILKSFENAQNDQFQVSLALPTSSMAAEALAQFNGIAVTNHSLGATSFGVTIPTDPAQIEAVRRDIKGAFQLVKPVSTVVI